MPSGDEGAKQAGADAAAGCRRRKRTIDPTRLPKSYGGQVPSASVGQASGCRGDRQVARAMMRSTDGRPSGRPYSRIRTMDPMPSGGADGREEGADAAEVEAGLAAERADLGRAGAVLPAGAAAVGEAGGRARAGAEPAMHAAAAVRHCRLAAGPAAAGAGGAARRGQEIAGRIAVLQAAPMVRREGTGGHRNRASGDGGGPGRCVWGHVQRLDRRAMFVLCSSISDRG